MPGYDPTWTGSFMDTSYVPAVNPHQFMPADVMTQSLQGVGQPFQSPFANAPQPGMKQWMGAAGMPGAQVPGLQGPPGPSVGQVTQSLLPKQAAQDQWAQQNPTPQRSLNEIIHQIAQTVEPPKMSYEQWAASQRKPSQSSSARPTPRPQPAPAASYSSDRMANGRPAPAPTSVPVSGGKKKPAPKAGGNVPPASQVRDLADTIPGYTPTWNDKMTYGEWKQPASASAAPPPASTPAYNPASAPPYFHGEDGTYYPAPSAPGGFSVHAPAASKYSAPWVVDIATAGSVVPAALATRAARAARGRKALQAAVGSARTATRTPASKAASRAGAASLKPLVQQWFQANPIK